MQSVQQQTTMQQQEWQQKSFLSHVLIAAVCGVWSPNGDDGPFPEILKKSPANFL